MKYKPIVYILLSTLFVTVLFLITYLFNNTLFSFDGNSAVKKIYFVDYISPAHRKIIDIFNSQNKNRIYVEGINLPFEKFSTNERKELLARFLRSRGERIDVFSVDQIWVPRFAKWTLSFDKNAWQKTNNSLLPSVLNSCYEDDRLVAIPLYVDISVMYGRMDLIEKLPNYKTLLEKLKKGITWDDFIELNQSVKNTQNPFFVFQGADYEGLLCIFVEMLASQRSNFVTKDSLTLVTKESIRALQLLIDMIHKYKCTPPDVLQFKENSSFRFYLKNNGYFLRGWPGFLGDNERIFTDNSVKKKIAAFPTPHFADGVQASLYGGWNLMISKNSTKIPETMQFIRFLTSIDAQKILFEESGYLPVNRALYEDSLYTARHPELLFFKKLMNHGVFRPFLKDYTNISDILSYYINSALHGDISAEEALRRASAKMRSGSIFSK